jgi:serine/threonine protein kinase
MTLAPGTKRGAYEILAPLGAGGMGEVYRARDTRLRRDVAINVLPQDVANDPERLAIVTNWLQATATSEAGR